MAGGKTGREEAVGKGRTPIPTKLHCGKSFL